eukprot:GHVN01043570.1.p1 GENE.GHVN01043570.1~~GHVN01043570.1.p1  ORF type:complete len:208 (-),score=14.70 GHVN01043570.1:317-940(-)
MGKGQRVKHAQLKKLLKPTDERLNGPNAPKIVKDIQKRKENERKRAEDALKPRQIDQVPISMFFDYNMQLGPPYHVLVDTNFVNFSIQHKLDPFKAMMDCLLAKSFPCVTDCVVGELEKMGHRFRLALRLVRDPRFKRLTCTHKGTYADDCIAQRVTESKCYIVATNDKDLKRRIRKIPGVPIMYVTQHKYAIERLPNGLIHVPLKK